MKSYVRFCTLITAVVFFLCAFAMPSVSQTPPGAELSNQQFAADNVLLDLTVRDKHNKPVLDLRPDQISVTDNGVPVKLANLRLVNGKQQDEPLITLFFDRPGIQSDQKDAENSAFGRSASTERDMSRRLRQAATKFLKGFPSQGFQFAVMDAWGRLQIEQGYTEDRGAIAQAVSMAVQPGQYGAAVTANAAEQRMAQVAKTGQDASGAAVSTTERALARSMVAALQSSSVIARDQHISLSLACMLALVRAQQSLPGRKAIVYFTSASDQSGTAAGRASRDIYSKDALRSIVGAANRAGVNIYLVRMDDLAAASQLTSMLDSFNSIRLPSAPSGGARGPLSLTGQDGGFGMLQTASSKSNSVTHVHDSLDSLASQTGGDVIDADEDTWNPVKELVRGLTTYYVASYVPPSGIEDGSFHATDLKTLRAGLKVRTRLGYLALPPNAGITDAPLPFELPLMALLKRPELPGEVSYRAAVLRMGHHEEGNLSVLALEAPVSGLQVREDSSTHLVSAHISVLANIRDSTGTVIERFSEDIPRRWEAGAGAAPEFISFERSFSAPPGAYTLETAILDNNSGKAAATRQSFEIPAFQALPELSDLVVSRGMEPAGADKGEPDALLFDGEHVHPNLDGQLPAAAPKVAVFFIAHADPGSQEPATVSLQVLRNGVPIAGAPMTSTLKPGVEFSPVLDSFSFSSAPYGRYQVRATLTQGRKSAQAIGDFSLMGNAWSGTDNGPGVAALSVDPVGLGTSAQTAVRPSEDEIDRILADVRKNAIEYGDALPNLICEQTTTRSIDSRGTGDWKHQDTIVELLTYVDRQEKRTVVGSEKENAIASGGKPVDNGMVSAGEFGKALNGIFMPSSKADFTWKQTSMLNREPVEVFAYRIARANSTFSLYAPDGSTLAGYHGQLYVDRTTHGVRSVTMITDDVPENFFIRRAAVRVDYDYVAINDHEYLLPVSAQVVEASGSKTLERNDLVFNNFRRFGSTLRILEPAPASKPQ
jgi:VWFA-related protein